MTNEVNNTDKGGIYQIKCLKTGKFYIGSTNWFARRFCQHKSDLNKNKHKNTYFQNIYNKRGLDNLEFKIIEILKDTSKKNLIKVENEYIGLSCPEINISKKATGGNPITKNFLLISPTGKIVEGYNILQFCKRNKLDNSCINAVILGRFRQYKGWTANFHNHLIWKYYGCGPVKLTKPIEIFHPKHGKEKVYSKSSFCKKWGLSHSSINSLLENKCKSFLGWQLNPISWDVYIHPKYGKVKICGKYNREKLINLSNNNVSRLKTGRQKVSKGWQYLGVTS